jgi:hypothetical protein
MDAETARGFLLPLTCRWRRSGSGTRLGKASNRHEAMARQPEAAVNPDRMIIGAAFIEALTIYA